MTNPIRLRASSVADLLDCPLRWEKRNLQGMKLPSTPPALIGTAVHASTAVYDQSELYGDGLTIDDAAGAAVDAISNPREEIDWMGSTLKKAIHTALSVHVDYCTQVAPTANYVAIEASLAPLLIEMPNGVVFEMTGTLDRVREKDGMRGIADVKTGGRAVNMDGEVVVGKHLPQLGTYELLGEQKFGAMILPSQIIGLNTVGGGRVGVGEVEGAKTALIGDQDEPGILSYVAPYFKSGLFPPNPGSWLCSNRYCPFFSQCIYHG
jgi:hypothetical protein